MSIFRSTIPSQYQFNNMTDFTHIKTDYIHVTTNLSNQYSTRLPFHGKSEPTIIVNTLVIFHVFQHNAQVPIHSDIFPNSRPVNARQGYKQKFKFVTASQAEKNSLPSWSVSSSSRRSYKVCQVAKLSSVRCRVFRFRAVNQDAATWISSLASPHGYSQVFSP